MNVLDLSLGQFTYRQTYSCLRSQKTFEVVEKYKKFSPTFDKLAIDGWLN
jgi:hypothetical protein